MGKLMNEENEWDHRILAEVKEGPADCIRIDKVAAALKKMKRHNTHTHTHNRFTAGLEYVRVHPGQQVPER